MLPRRCKEFIGSLINYFERERDEGGPLLPLTAVRERVAEALNISLKTVSRVSQVCKSGNPLQSPKKTKKREKPVTDVDDFDHSAIRNVIYEMIQNKKYVTQKTLLRLALRHK